MKQNIKKLLGLVNEQKEEYVSPADVAMDVSTLHDTLDDIKEYSVLTAEWLRKEQARFSDSGDNDIVSELDDLVAYVESLYYRIELGDESIRTSTSVSADVDSSADVDVDSTAV